MEDCAQPMMSVSAPRCLADLMSQPVSPKDDEVDLGSEDTESTDEDYVDNAKPEKKIRKKRRRLKKKRKRVPLPNLDELSLPKPAARLDERLDLGDAHLKHVMVDDSVRPTSMQPLTPSGGRVELLIARKPTRGSPDDARVAEYRKFYDKQLPGLPFYYDGSEGAACVYQAMLTLDDAAASSAIVGGATFRLLTLTTQFAANCRSDGTCPCATTGSCGARVLIVDVLALAANPDVCRRGLGSMVVESLKSIARREAAAIGAIPLLLTQADLGCVGFWAKQGFARALDANALVRSLRRAAELTIFLHATPMACLLPAVHKRPR